MCHPDLANQIDVQDVEVIWDVPAFATARAIADASGTCTSSGTAFGCAKAKSQAAAWAAATAEAHAGAYAQAFNGCGICPDNAVETSASAEVYASTFIELMADVYAQAEIQVCVAGTQSSSATAWSNCFAHAFTRIVRPPLSPLAPACKTHGCVQSLMRLKILKRSLFAERKGNGRLPDFWQLRPFSCSGVCACCDGRNVH
jgi:hypothetical protein